MAAGSPHRVPQPRSGTEPANARTLTRARIVLAGFGLVACVVASVWLLYEAKQGDPADATFLVVVAGFCAAGALIAVADLVVLLRRQHRAHHRPRRS